MIRAEGRGVGHTWSTTVCGKWVTAVDNVSSYIRLKVKYAICSTRKLAIVVEKFDKSGNLARLLIL